MLCFDVNGLRVGRCVTERLHGEIRGEAETRKILQFVPCHRSCGVLRTDSCHFGFAVGAGSNSFNTTGAPHHLLCEGEARIRLLGHIGLSKEGALAQAQRFPCLGGQATTDNEIDSTTGTDLVQQYVRAQLELGDNVTRLVKHLSVIDTDINDIAHAHLLDGRFEDESACIFHGVVEDRRNFAANAHTTHLLVGDTCYRLAEIPQDAVSGRLSGRASAYDIAYKRDG